MSIDHLVPISRLTERMVRSGLVTAWRLATSPTSTSPLRANATMDGVVREPSAFAMTVGSPPSRTATTELVVPRSMPTARAMVDDPPVKLSVPDSRLGVESGRRKYARRSPPPAHRGSLADLGLGMAPRRHSETKIHFGSGVVAPRRHLWPDRIDERRALGCCESL